MSQTMPAGWYPDPAGTSYNRYWDGEAWTNDLRADSSPLATSDPPVASGSVEDDVAPSAPGPRIPSRHSWLIGVAAVVVVATVAVVLAMSSAARKADDEAHTVPDISGLTAEAAQSLLEAAGFTVAFKGGEPAGIELSKWEVTAQAPEAGERADDMVVAVWASTSLRDAASKCRVNAPVDGGTTLLLDMEGEDVASGDLSYGDVTCVLEDLDVPSSVTAKMTETRALDGRQSDSWKDVTASWSYHPDNGLDIILELK